MVEGASPYHEHVSTECTVNGTVRPDRLGCMGRRPHAHGHGTLRIVYYLYLSYILYNYITHATFF